MYAHIEVTEEVIIPFNTKQIKVVNDIPIAIKIVQGKVPNYYNSKYGLLVFEEYLKRKLEE